MSSEDSINSLQKASAIAHSSWHSTCTNIDILEMITPDTDEERKIITNELKEEYNKLIKYSKACDVLEESIITEELRSIHRSMQSNEIKKAEQHACKDAVIYINKNTLTGNWSESSYTGPLKSYYMLRLKLAIDDLLKL